MGFLAANITFDDHQQIPLLLALGYWKPVNITLLCQHTTLLLSTSLFVSYHFLLQIWCMNHPEPSMTLDGDVLTAIMAIENYKIFDMNTHLWDEPEKERLMQSGKFLNNSDFTIYPNTIFRSILWMILSYSDCLLYIKGGITSYLTPFDYKIWDCLIREWGQRVYINKQS